ncbi:Ribokinase [Candidatus Magnetaquicoccaceae bacterium FCR-1]|uniref:Ribokinase n=1 Tax=Candidatus Magnetaquiglobus chichijimensis TaxID=3141448 RepID=A0ABQ0CDJ6_9PROT
MKRHHVYGIGHALVDTEIRVTDDFLKQAGLTKGSMTLIDEARRAELLALLGDAPRHRACGGSSANTLIGVAQLGGNAFHASRVASDENGLFFTGDMRANGVANDLEKRPRTGTTGQCLVLITPDAERTMCTHLGISEFFSAEDLAPEELAASEWLYVEGYLVTSPSARHAACKAVSLAREHGVKIALTFSDASMIDYFGAGLEEIMGSGVDLIFCNQTEALRYAGSDDLEVAKAALARRAPAFGLTLGAQGAVVRLDGRDTLIPGMPVQAIDANGAGDLFAGALLYGLTHGFSPERAGRLACRASARLVTRHGARLSREETRDVLNTLD